MFWRSLLVINKKPLRNSSNAYQQAKKGNDCGLMNEIFFLVGF